MLGPFLDLFGCDYRTQYSAPSFEEKFLLEIATNGICLGSASKQNALL